MVEHFKRRNEEIFSDLDEISNDEEDMSKPKTNQFELLSEED